MKILTYLISLFISISGFSQYREIYDKELWYLQQSDSLYKANRVKTRTTYRLSDLNQNQKVKKLKLTFDREGRISEMEFEPFFGGRFQTTYFQYNAQGTLVNMYSVLVKGQPSKELLNFIGDDPDLMKKLRDLPKRETMSYHIEPQSDTATQYVKKNEAGELQATMLISRNNQRALYTGTLKENRITTYLPNKTFQYLPTYYTVWYGNPPATNEYRFEYRFSSNQIQQMTVRKFSSKELYSTDVYQLQYNKAGLLTRAAIDYGTHVYEYTYY